MGFDVSKLVVPLLDGVFVFVFVLVFVFVFHVSKLTVPLLEGVFVLEVVFKVVSTDSCLCVQLHLDCQCECPRSHLFCGNILWKYRRKNEEEEEGIRRDSWDRRQHTIRCIV